MANLPDIEKTVLAKFKTLTGSDTVEVAAHFNPASLQYTVSNTLKEEGSGAKKKQYVSQTTAKLTMDLVFDTTATGVDVRSVTDKTAKLLKPIAEGGKHVPPKVEFSWGAYVFVGMVEQYKETLDFFAASGVPLRSSVNITLSSQDDVSFDSPKNPQAKVDRDLAPQHVMVPDRSGPGGGAAGLANALGDPRSARGIAAVNGSASLRFGVGGELAVGGGVSLSAAAAFSAGASVGAGVGIGGGVGIGAGVGASAGAFSGLQVGAGTSLSLPDGRALLQRGGGATAGAGVQFGPGGQAQAQGGASLGADVGASADLGARISFNS